MESRTTPAEDLPALYRAILDAVAELEQRGARRQAARIRASATLTYSSRWDDRGRQRLQQLYASAVRSVAASDHDRESTGRRRLLVRRQSA